LNSSNQNTVLSYEIDPHVVIQEANVTEGGDVKMKWSCGHEGHLNLEWMRKHCYSSQSLERARKSCAPTPLTQGSMPGMDAKELEDDYGVWRWLRILNEYGACLVKGVPCTTEDGMKFTQKMCPYLQETFYGGRTQIKVVDNPVTVSYSSCSLEPHMDIPMYESYPGVNLLQCVRNDECVDGGESVVIDTLAVVEKLRVTHPHHFATLVRVPATFQRIHYQRENPVNMVYRTPLIHLNGHDEIVKLRWSPHNEGPLQVAEEDVEAYYEAYSCLAKLIHSDHEHQIHLRLQPGDVLTVNNYRMLHGRTDIKLNGGVRFLNNFAINIDDFKSRLLVLCSQFDPDYQPKNILNHDFSFSRAARMI
jgi:gamma-butyrobetaine dioxygenase